MADLVTRLKLDDTQFNENIRKSKKQVKDFGSTCQQVGKQISKAFIVLEGIKLAIESLSFAFNSSASAARTMATAMDTARIAVSNFFSSLFSGNWDAFNGGFKKAIQNANEFSQKMYDVGKGNEYSTFYADYIEGRRNQLEYKITSDNTSASEKKAAEAEYAQLAAEETAIRQGIINDNLSAIHAGLRSKGIYEEYTVQELIKMASDVHKSGAELTKQQQALRDLLSSNDLMPYINTIITNTDKIGTISKDADDAKTDVRDKTDNSPSDLDLLAWNAEGWANEEVKGLHNKIRKAIKNGDKIPIQEMFIEIDDEVEELGLGTLSDEPSKWAMNMADAFGLAGASISALGASFAAFSENAALAKSALILGAIGQLVYSYAEASRKCSSPWEWIAFAISGAATVATVIGQLSSYASGGVVDSPYTTGDKNLVRVNGGEMILTKGQQLNLFNMLNNGTASNGGGNVTFRIQGKELVGVLNNYNNKVSKVL